MVGPIRPQFVLFGSSIVQMSFSNGGWGAVLADLYSRQDATFQPSLVIVYFGGNDSMLPDPLGFSLHVPLPEYVENLRKIATHLKSLSEKTRIIFLGAPPLNEEQTNEAFRGIMQENSRTYELCQMYSDACVRLCREMDIKVVDLFACFNAEKKRLVCFVLYGWNPFISRGKQDCGGGDTEYPWGGRLGTQPPMQVYGN